VAGRKKAPFPKITPVDAHAALRWLHATGKVTAKEIAGAIHRREALVREIRARLEALAGGGLRFLRGPEALRPRKRRRRVSAKARAAWAAQGRYIGAVRSLSKADRVKVKAIRQAKGVAAAIAAARMAKP